MSLAEAILDVAKRLEDDACAVEVNNEPVAMMLKCYAQELKTAVKAGQGHSEVNLPSVKSTQTFLENIHEQELTRQKKEAKRVLENEENSQGRMVEVIGGNCDGTYTIIDSRMPVNAKTALGSDVYVLHEDGKLYYSEVDTKKFLHKSM